MNKKVKLGLGGLGFLGANGAIIPNLENSLNSLKSFSGFNSGGGTLRTKRDIRGDSYQLKFGDNSLGSVPKLTLDRSPSKSLELQINDTRGEALLSSSTDNYILGAKSGNEHSNSIKTILEEINKEAKLTSIGSKTSSRFDELFKKHFPFIETKGKSPLSIFQEIKSLIHQWRGQGGRSGLSSKALTTQQKINLRKFYELFGELTSEKKTIFKELQGVDSDSDTLDLKESSPSSSPDFQAIKKVLNLLKWDTFELRLQKNPPRKNSKRLTTTTDDWGEWNANHPFFNFYDSQDEFKQALESLNANHQTVHTLRRSHDYNRTEYGSLNRWSRSHFRAQGQQIQELSSNVSVDIENHIASKLLEWMGQLNK